MRSKNNKKPGLEEDGGEAKKGSLIEEASIIKENSLIPQARATYFSAIKSVEEVAENVFKRKKDVDDRILNLKIFPSELIINDYYFSQENQTFEIIIKNFSRKLKKFKILTTKTSYFRVINKVEIKKRSNSRCYDFNASYFSIAPGMEFFFSIQFTAPKKNKNLNEKNVNYEILKDSVEIILEDETVLTLPMKAIPIKSDIEVPIILDFGSLFYFAKSPQGKPLDRLSKRTQIKNQGKRGGNFKIMFDKTFPIEIFPKEFSLEASGCKLDTVDIEVTLLSLKAGIFQYDVFIESELEKEAKKICIIGEIGQKIQIRNADTNVLLDPAFLNFGIIFQGETKTLPIKLENKGDTYLHWCLNHAGELQPNVPGKYQSCDPMEEMKKSAISVTPSEGIIEPHQSSLINFKFSPIVDHLRRNFKSLPKKESVAVVFRVPMQLNILNEDNKKNMKEQPINFILNGVACPLEVTVSSTELLFKETDLEDTDETFVTLENNSSELALKFEFKKIAQFYTTPNSGKLGPTEKIQIKVTFKPNQIGEHKNNLLCYFSSILNSADIQCPNSKKKRLSLLVIGKTNINSVKKTLVALSEIERETNANCKKENLFKVDKPKVETKKEIMQNKLGYKKFTVNKEREDKVKNRNLYIDYIRSLHKEKVSKVRESYFDKGSIVKKFQSTSLFENCHTIDPQTGLTEPDPFENINPFKNIKSDFKCDNSFEDTNTHSEEKALKLLFDRLFEPVVQKSKVQLSNPKSASISQNPLNQSELSSVYVSTSKIDLGSISVHSVNNIPINFLNAIPSKKHIHVAIINYTNEPGSELQSLPEEFSVTPSSIIVPPMQVLGVGVSFQTNKPGKYAINLQYLVNARYRYHIEINVNVVPLNLKLDSEIVNIPIDFSEILGVQFATVGKNNGNNFNFDLRPGTTDSDALNDKINADGLDFSELIGEKTIKIKNEGNYPASFFWSGGKNLMLKKKLPKFYSLLRKEATKDFVEHEGYFKIHPFSGKIMENSSIDVKISFHPGIRAVVEEELKLNVVDDYLNHDPVLVSSTLLKVKGELPASKTSLVTSVKQQIDLGILTTSFTNNKTIDGSNGKSIMDLSKYNILSTLNQSDNTQSSKKKTRSIKIKNCSSHISAYMVRKSLQSDLEFSSTNGFIPGNGGILEIFLSALPKKTGVTEEYEGRMSEIGIEELEEDLCDILVGSWGIKNFNIVNKGPVHARVIIDLRQHPEFTCRKRPAPHAQFQEKLEKRNSVINRVLTPDENFLGLSGSFDKSTNGRKLSVLGAGPLALSTHFSGRTSTVGHARNIKKRYTELDVSSGGSIPDFYVITPQDHLYDFDKVEGKKELTGNLYVVDFHQGEKWELQLLFKPKKVKSHDYKLPIMTIGNPTLSHLSIVAFSTPSPILISKTNINFKHRVIFKQPVITAQTLGNNNKEIVVLKNCTNTALRWWFDLRNSPEFEKNFKVEPAQGVIPAKQSLNLSLWFKPEAAGGVQMDIPLFCDKSKDPFLFTLQGTGMEPSLTLDPPELYLPIVPLGESSLAVFSIANYGCERAEIDYKIAVESIERYGNIEVLFPEGNLLKSDGENVKLLSKQPFKSPAGIILDAEANIPQIESFYIKTVIFDLIVNLSGKKLNGLVSISAIAAPIEDRVKYLYRQYHELLTQLETIGGMMSNIKPELLLSEEEFKLYNKQRYGHLNVAESLNHIKNAESNFSVFSKEAWCTLILQIIRIFVTTNITPKSFKSLPGVEKSESLLSWSTSNKCNSMYSTSDAILLKWVSYHLFKKTKILRRIVNFSTDFCDGSVLMLLLTSHFPKMTTTHFSTFHINERADEQLDHEKKLENLIIIHSVLIDLFPGCIGIKKFPMKLLAESPKEAALEVYLLIVLLYQTLPQFLVQSKMEFDGELHEKVTKRVEISNTGFNAMVYNVDIDNNAFKFKVGNVIDAKEVTLEPHTSDSLRIEFTSRFIKKVEGTMTLKSIKFGLNSSSVIIFRLCGSVCTSKVKKNIIHLKAPMYHIPPLMQEFEITNPLGVKGSFDIILSEKKKILLSEPEFPGKQNPDSFFISKNQIDLEVGESRKLHLSFIPFLDETYEGQLHFIDKDVGEFFYHIEGKSSLPAPTENLFWASRAKNSLEKVFRISPFSSLREKAIYYALHQNKGFKSSEAYHLPNKALRYSITYSSQYFRGPTEITLPIKNGKQFLERNEVEVMLTFSPKLPGKYFCKMVLNCLDCCDVRVYNINATAIAQGSTCEIEFHTPARQLLIQEVPFSNQTKEEWTIRVNCFDKNLISVFLQASFQGVNNSGFSGPSVLTIPPFTNGVYPVSFSPTKASEVKSVLTLFNLLTTQKHVYYLKGHGQDPLPENTFDINCSARDKKFLVKNYGDSEAEFEVVTNLPNAQGLSMLKVPANETIIYETKINPLISGKYAKHIYFVNKIDSTYSWYNLQLIVKPPPREDVISLTVQVRKSIDFQLKLTNPLLTKIEYQVELSGKNLKGDSFVKLEYDEEKLYNLSYVPMVPQKSTGFVKFLNEEIGEFWYELALEATDCLPFILPEMNCPLGKCCFQIITLDNPLNEVIVYDVNNSNSRDFRVFVSEDFDSEENSEYKYRHASVDVVSIDPLATINIKLVFWPSSVTESRTRSGLLPEVMDVKTVYGTIGDTIFSVLNFYNPLADPISVSVNFIDDLEEINEKSKFDAKNILQLAKNKTFTLLNKKSLKIHVGALDTMEIPFTFKPVAMNKAETKIVVEMNQHLKWIFPIKGVSEKPLSPFVQVLEAKVGENSSSEFDITLQGFCEGLKSNTSLKYQKMDWKKFVSFSICNPASNSATTDQKKSTNLSFILLSSTEIEDNSLQLKFKAIFSPKRISEVSYHLLITNLINGGRWKFPIKLVGLPSTIDDTIIIEGNIGKRSTVSFSINNFSDRPKQFVAFFTPETSGEFAVVPKKGILLPSTPGEDNADNKFLIDYKPSAYGKTNVGILIIETDDSFWSFNVRGVPHVQKKVSLLNLNKNQSKVSRDPSFSSFSDMGGQSITNLQVMNNGNFYDRPNITDPHFGKLSFSEEEYKQIAGTLKRSLGPEYISTRSGPGGTKVSYLEGWKSTHLANEALSVFGFNGWSSQILNFQVDFCDIIHEKRVSLGLSALVRITLKDVIKDVGYGNIENAKTKAAAFEKCKKEAVTDAMKRTLKNFGLVMGACLYDKEYLKRIKTVKNDSIPFEYNKLYRSPEFRELQQKSQGTNNSDNSVDKMNHIFKPNDATRFENVELDKSSDNINTKDAMRNEFCEKNQLVRYNHAGNVLFTKARQKNFIQEIGVKNGEKSSRLGSCIEDQGHPQWKIQKENTPYYFQQGKQQVKQMQSIKHQENQNHSMGHENNLQNQIQNQNPHKHVPAHNLDTTKFNSALNPVVTEHENFVKINNSSAQKKESMIIKPSEQQLSNASDQRIMSEMQSNSVNNAANQESNQKYNQTDIQNKNIGLNVHNNFKNVSVPQQRQENYQSNNDTIRGNQFYNQNLNSPQLKHSYKELNISDVQQTGRIGGVNNILKKAFSSPLNLKNNLPLGGNNT
ncbi:Cilia- and flagella-associated protein 47 [Clydaea vesicula]|uniref:Cilia- and flagella-associated protein 47 n=1 Tax=Clydaea vesicula TaxID=447962 RepID=A0AAD5U1G0_9FUNG|nr:Cilia- and flagella-associated protein 47 [Clydaea vesicula]